jgi:hypothetical protein
MVFYFILHCELRRVQYLVKVLVIPSSQAQHLLTLQVYLLIVLKITVTRPWYYLKCWVGYTQLIPFLIAFMNATSVTATNHRRWPSACDALVILSTHFALEHGH